MKKYLVIVIVGLLLYSNSLTNNFVWEDWDQIADNPVVQNVKNIPTFFSGGTYFESVHGNLTGNLYRPAMLSFFSIISALFGVKPFMFHFSQVILHIANAILVYLLLKKFLKENISFWLSLLFLVHPMNTEVVSYIAITNDALYFFFGILGLLLIPKNLFVSGLLMLLALFSKESGVLFLIMAVPYTFIYYRDALKKVIVMCLIVGAVYMTGRLGLAHIGSVSTGFFPMERLSLLSRISLIPRTIVFYLTMFIFPLNLSIARQWNAPSNLLIEFFVPLLIVCLISAILFLFIKHSKKRINLYFFLLWAGIGMLPYIQITPLNMSVAERWFYFAQIGVLGFLGSLEFKFFKHPKLKYLFFIIFVVFGIRTFIRNFDWKDDTTIFRHDSKINTDSYMIETGLGIADFQENKLDDSERHFLKSLSLFPYGATVSTNLGSLYETKKDFPKAIEYFGRSAAAFPTLFVYERLTTLEVVSGQVASAKKDLEEGLKRYPYSGKLHLNRGLIYYKDKDYKNAESEIRKGYDYSKENYYLEILKKVLKKEEIIIEY